MHRWEVNTLLHKRRIGRWWDVFQIEVSQTGVVSPSMRPPATSTTDWMLLASALSNYRLIDLITSMRGVHVQARSIPRSLSLWGPDFEVSVSFYL